MKILEGNNWTLYKLKVNGIEYTTFNEFIANKFVLNKEIEFEYEVKGKYKNIIKVVENPDYELSEETKVLILAVKKAHEQVRTNFKDKKYQDVFKEEYKRLTGKDYGPISTK